MANEVKTPIPARIYNAAVGGHVAGTEDIYDDTKGKTQKQINTEVEQSLGSGGSVDSRIQSAVNNEKNRAEGVESSQAERITTLENAVGSGGSVDERIATEGAKHYLKSETYTKEEVNGMITTPEQGFVSVSADAQTTAATDVLPATGEADTIYRIANWDGSQYDTSVYSEYSWNTSTNTYIKLSTKQVGIDNVPTDGSHKLVESGGVFAINSLLLEENRIILNNGYSYSQLYSNNEKETGLLKDDGTVDSSYTNYETSMYLPTLATADIHRFFMVYVPFAEHNNYGGLPNNCVSLAYYKKINDSSAKFVASKRLYHTQTIFVPKGYCVRVSVETDNVKTIKYHNSPYGAISIDESIKKFSSDIINLNNILPNVAIPINSSIMVNGGMDMSIVGNQTVSVPIFDAEGKDYILITSNSQPSDGELRYLIQWYNTDGSDGGYTGWTNNGQIAVSKRFFRILVAIYNGSSYINLSPSDIDSCGIKFYGQKTQKDNILFNKKIAILGDSITAGGQYTTVLHNHANVTILNYGVSGTRIANYVNDDQSNSFLNRVSTMDDSADLAIVFGGVNDWGSGTILGSLSTLNDNSTFYGALYQMTTALINKYGAEKIIYMTPLHAQSPSAEKEEYTYNNGVLSPNKYGIAQGTGYLIDYVNAIIEIATLFSIQVIDLYHNVGICPLVPSNSTLYTQDGLHPNAAGGALIAKYIKPIIENTISKNIW